MYIITRWLYSMSLTLLSLSMFSCAHHFGAYSPAAVAPNVIYQDVAIGTASTSYFLGFGGLSKDALVHEAKKNLFKARPLKMGESYHNYTVNFKWAFYGLVNKTKVTITADVVAATTDSVYEPFSVTYKTKLGIDTTNSLNIFAIGDSAVIFNRKGLREGVVIGLSHHSKKITLKYNNNVGELLTRKYAFKKVYSYQKTIAGYKRGVKVALEITENDETKIMRNATVVAVALNDIMFDIDGKIEVIEIKKITWSKILETGNK